MRVLTRVLAALLASTAATADAKPKRVLVLELRTDDSVDGKASLQLTSAIAEAISKQPQLDVLTMLDVKDALSHEESRLITECTTEASCTTNLRRLEDVDFVVVASAGLVGKSLTISLALFENWTSIIKNRVSLVVDPRDGSIESQIRTSVQQLFGSKEAPSKPAFVLGDKPTSFAIFDLVASGVSEETATNLTQILGAELKRAKGASVIGRQDVKAMLTLEADKQMLGCADESCLAELGAALGVDYLVAGHVGKIAGTYMVSLRLIAPDSLEVKNRVSESFVGEEEQLLGAVRHAGRMLIGLGLSDKGQLVLSTNAGDGRILIDGGEVDESKMPALLPGRHHLRIEKDDYLEWRGDIYVQPIDPTALTVELQERPTEWYESWIFWTAIAGAALAAGGAGVGLSLANGGDGPGSGEEVFPFGLEVALPAR